MNPSITLPAIEKARNSITGIIRTTPVIESPTLQAVTDTPVYLKLEHQQITGSFKLRGAANAIATLTEQQRNRGVVAVSTGNHGRGLAYAARKAGVPCIVCMSKLVPQNKLDGIKAQGAEVRIIGSSQDDAQKEVDRLVAEDGMTMLPPFDHPAIIAGQGTLGLELAEQVPSAETVLVQISGGGLISGLATAMKAKLKGLRVIAISMERGAAMYECQKAGQPILVEEVATRQIHSVVA